MSDIDVAGEHDAGFSVLENVVDIVSAYVSNNSVPSADLPGLISTVHASVQQILVGQTAPVPEVPKEPAVPVRKSVTNDFIVCLEDGKKFKSLKRHLSTAYGMTPDEYRAKWGLPGDYPMVAPGYSATRSKLAKAIGLGNARTAAKAVEAGAKVTEPSAKKPGRGRKPKDAAA